jgi:hypothetical protein
MLAWKQNEANLKKAVKLLVVHFVRTMAVKYAPVPIPG